MKTKLINLCVIISVLFSLFVPVCRISAASLTTLSDTLNHLKIGIDANHIITFTTPSGVAAGQTIAITFPSDFSTSSVDYTDIDLEDDGVDLALAAAASGATWGAVFSGTDNRTLTFTSGTGTIAASSIITIKIGTNATFGVVGDQAINNPTTSGTYAITIAGTFGDAGAMSVVILTDDQIQVTGTIDNTLSFSISNNSVGFGSFASTNVRYATADGKGDVTEQANDSPSKLTAGTNASRGLAISVYDQGSGSAAGLYNSAALELVPSAPSTEVLNNSKKYGVYGKNASSLVIDEAFDNDATNDLAISRSSQVFALASSPVNNGTVDIALLAAIDATTKAGAYSDTLTLVCTGNY